MVNGDEYDGTCKDKLFINPSNVPSATYTVVEELWMFDDPGGLSPKDLTNVSLQVGDNYPGSDFDRPVASSLTLSPTYVDVSSGGVTVTLSVRVSDTSGVYVTNTRGAYIHPYANVLNDNKDFTNWSLVNGDEYDGTYETKLFINPSNVPSATYTVVEELWMFDDPGGLSPQDLTNVSLQVKIIIQGLTLIDQ